MKEPKDFKTSPKEYRVWYNGKMYYDDLRLGNYDDLSINQLNRIFMMPDTVLLQRTGLYDKNNKKIREGDIIQLGENKYGVIVFRHGRFAYDFHLHSLVIKNGLLQQRLDCRTDTIEQEVVGNIFENSSLLQ